MNEEQQLMSCGSRWQDYAIKDFTAGMLDIIDDNMIPEGAARVCENVICRTVGKLSKRKGYRKATRLADFDGPIQGIYPHYNSVGQHNLMLAAGGKIYRFDGENFVPLGGSFDANANLEFAHGIMQGEDSIIGFNGIERPFKWNGGSLSAIEVLRNYLKIDNEKPTTTDFKTYTCKNPKLRTDSLIITSNGELIKDGYTVNSETGTVTFDKARINSISVAEREQTVGWLNFTKFTVENPFIPNAANETDAVKVFDRGGNPIARESYHVVEDDGGRGAIVFSTSQAYRAPLFVAYKWADDIRIDYHYEVTSAENIEEMKSMRYPAIHQGRIFVTSSQLNKRSQIWFSEINEPESWPAINFWEVKPGDGDEITKLMPFFGELIIFKKRSIHTFKGFTMEDFRLDEIEPRVGCVGPRAAAIDSLNIYMVSEQGLCRFNGMRVVNLTSERIPSFWERVNLNAIHKAVVEVWNGLVLAALPIDASNDNNIVLVYDTKTGAFWLWTNMPITNYCILVTSEGKRLYSSHVGDKFLYHQDVNYKDDDKEIQAYWEGRAFDMMSAEREKKVKKVFIEDAPTTYVPARFKLSIDYNEFRELEMRGRHGTMRMYYVPADLRRFRYFIPRIEHNEGPFELRGIMFPFKPKRKPKVRRGDANYSGHYDPDEFDTPWGDIFNPLNPQIREFISPEIEDIDIDFIRVYYTNRETSEKIGAKVTDLSIVFMDTYNHHKVLEDEVISPSITDLSISFSLLHGED